MIKAAHAILVVGAALAVLALASSLISNGVAGTNGSEAVSAASEACCFTNPRYTGVCTVVPGEDESCPSILAYLNNPNSSGKAYCGGTTIRGGWQQVACEDAADAFKAPDLR